MSAAEIIGDGIMWTGLAIIAWFAFWILIFLPAAVLIERLLWVRQVGGAWYLGRARWM